MEKPAKKIKLSPDISDQINNGNDDGHVQLMITDMPSSSDRGQYSLLRNKLCGEKVRSCILDLKLVGSMKDPTTLSINPTCIFPCSKTGELFIACKHGQMFVEGTNNSIRVHDLNTKALKRQIPIGTYEPVRLWVDEEGEQAIFCNSGRTKYSIVKYNLKEEKVVWECFGGKSKGGMAFKKSTNEIFVACWKEDKILVLDVVTGSLKYEIKNEKTKGISSLYYEEKTDSLIALTSSSLYIGSEYNGKTRDKCYILRLQGQNYVNCDTLMEFDDESFQRYELGNYGFSTAFLNSKLPYFILFQQTKVYAFDKITKKLLAKIETNYKGSTDVYQYCYNEDNGEIYRYAKCDEYVDVLQLCKVENNFIEVPLAKKACDAIKKLGGTFPKEIVKYRYRNEYIISDALAYFINIKFETDTMFRYLETMEDGEEDEEDSDGEEIKEEQDPEDDDDANGDDEEMKEVEEQDPEDDDEKEDYVDYDYSKSFPLKYSWQQDRANDFGHDIKEWLSTNPDGMIIAGNFDRNSLERNEFAFGVKVSECDNSDFPVYLIGFGPYVSSFKISTLVSNLKSVNSFDLMTYHVPKKATYNIDFAALYKELIQRKAINPETKEIDSLLLLESYRKMTCTGMHTKNHVIFTMGTLIFQEQSVEFDNTKFRKTDLLVLAFGLGLDKMISESNKHECILLRFDEMPFDDVLC